MFKIINYSLGTIKVGSKHILQYPFENIELITSIESPCDCAVPTIDYPNTRITIEYIAKPISEHLRIKGQTSQYIQKGITVRYTVKGNTTDSIPSIIVLSFNATVIQ